MVSENLPSLMTEGVQLVAEGLKYIWKLHPAYCPRIFRKVE